MKTLRRSVPGSHFALDPPRARAIASAIVIVIALIAIAFIFLRLDLSDKYAHDPYWSYLFVYPFLQMPPSFLLPAFAFLGAIIGLGVHAAFIKAGRLSYFKAITGEHNEIVGHFLGLVGVIYAVVLAFIVAIAWQSYSDARRVAEEEQHDAVLLFQIMDGYHDANRASAVKQLLLKYATDLDSEWRTMEKDERLCYFNGDDCPQGSFDAALDSRKIVHSVVALSSNRSQESEDEQDAVVYQKSIDVVGSFTDARNQRRHHYDDRLSGALWLSFLIGAFIVVAVSYLVGSQDPRSQRVRTMALGAMVGMMIGLVVIFDYPYTGDQSATFSGQNWCRAARYFAGPHEGKKLQLRDCPPPAPEKNKNV